MSTFRFFSIENNSFFTLTRKFVSFHFGFNISLKFLNEIGLILLSLKAVSLKAVSFRYRNDLKISLKKRIGFVHVDITSQWCRGHH
jgi:hypothetical protein